MKWIALLLSLVANAALLLIALGPALVTRVPSLPPSLLCATCRSPAIEAAIKSAYQAGGAGVLAEVSSHTGAVLGLTALNVVVTAVALFAGRSKA